MTVSFRINRRMLVVTTILIGMIYVLFVGYFMDIFALPRDPDHSRDGDTSRAPNLAKDSEININEGGAQRWVVFLITDESMYNFYAPLSALAWRALGYTPIVLVLSNHFSPGLKEAVRHSTEIGARVVFVERRKAYSLALWSQMARLYAPFLSFVSEGDYVMLADADAWPLNKKFFTSPFLKDTYDAHIIGANAFKLPDPQFPICYIGMTQRVWREVLSPHGKTLEDMVEHVLEEKFEPDIAVDSDTLWTFDQVYIGKAMRAWSRFSSATQLIDRPGFPDGFAKDRLDRARPEEFEHPDITDKIDAHLPRLAFEPDNWKLCMNLLELLVSNRDAIWAEEYRETYLAALQRERKQSDEPEGHNNWDEPMRARSTITGNVQQRYLNTVPRRPRVLFFGVTYDKNHDKARACEKTWGKRVTAATGERVIWFSNQDAGPDMEVKIVTVPEGFGYGEIFYRMLAIWSYVYREYPSYDFYFRCWDDNYVIAERIIAALSYLNSSEPVVAGRLLHYLSPMQADSVIYAGGGAGTAHSREALRRWVQKDGADLKQCKIHGELAFAEDLHISKCSFDAGSKLIGIQGLSSQTLGSDEVGVDYEAVSCHTLVEYANEQMCYGLSPSANTDQSQSQTDEHLVAPVVGCMGGQLGVMTLHYVPMDQLPLIDAAVYDTPCNAACPVGTERTTERTGPLQCK